MNKHLFVIFLTAFSLSLCASSQPMYFDYPGQTGLVRSLSFQENGGNYRFQYPAHWFEVPSQSASSYSTPLSSNQSTPEMQRRVDEVSMALALASSQDGARKKLDSLKK